MNKQDTIMKSANKNNNLIEVLKWIETLVIAILIAIAIRGFVIEPVIVNGISMEDTLHSGQRLIIYKLGYYFNPPQRGDIIVLQYQKGHLSNIPLLRNLTLLNKAFPSAMEIDYVKRVIGVPGDEIDLKDGFVYINGEKQTEIYAKGETHQQVLEFPQTVPPDKVLVLGDNRQYSRDSRVIGFIEYDRIKGKAILIVWPFKDFGKLK